MKDKNDAPEVIDLRKQYPQQYSQGKKLLEYDIGEATYLSVAGKGPPGGDEFGAAIQALYSTVYTTKFTLKAEGKMDFKILPLECVYGNFDPHDTPAQEWQWTMQIRVPAELTAKHVGMACIIIKERKGIEITPPEVVTEPGGHVLQLLHVGPYENFQETYDKLGVAAEERGLEILAGQCREVYLSDPRRAKPEKLKTIVRVMVR